MKNIKRFNENWIKDTKDFFRDPTGEKRREERRDARNRAEDASLGEYRNSVDICIEYNENTEEFKNAIDNIENGNIEDVEFSLETNSVGFSHLANRNVDKDGNFYKINFMDGTSICVMRGHEFETSRMEYHPVTTMMLKGKSDTKFTRLGNGVIPNGVTDLGMWNRNSGFISYSSYLKIKNAALEYLENNR